MIYLPFYARIPHQMTNSEEETCDEEAMMPRRSRRAKTVRARRLPPKTPAPAATKRAVRPPLPILEMDRIAALGQVRRAETGEQRGSRIRAECPPTASHAPSATRVPCAHAELPDSIPPSSCMPLQERRKRRYPLN